MAIFIVLLSLSTNAVAANKTIKNKKVDAKCHVELTQGREVIYFATVKEGQVNNLVDIIVNRKIIPPFSKDKQQIYRAFECVLLSAKFNADKANELFDKQPR